MVYKRVITLVNSVNPTTLPHRKNLQSREFFSLCKFCFHRDPPKIFWRNNELNAHPYQISKTGFRKASTPAITIVIGKAWVPSLSYPTHTRIRKKRGYPREISSIRAFMNA